MLNQHIKTSENMYLILIIRDDLAPLFEFAAGQLLYRDLLPVSWQYTISMETYKQ